MMRKRVKGYLVVIYIFFHHYKECSFYGETLVLDSKLTEIEEMISTKKIVRKCRLRSFEPDPRSI